MKTNSHRFRPTITMLKKDCHNIVKETDVPGFSIALVTRNDTVWMEGFGYTDRKKTKKVDENTRFAYQSTGKSIVAAIALKAVQDGLTVKE
jgi:CubicO group peptidase (beta-lactamase class C family)